MKLYYWKQYQRENFGDDLNHWLWSKILPDYLDDDPRITLIGIGTLINQELPRRTSQAIIRLIFSTGVGYGDGILPEVDSSYKFYCVRGPLSAKKLGLEPELAITDGAVLVSKFYPTSEQKKIYKFSFMPHHRHAYFAWEDVCQDLGFGYINPTWSTEKVLAALSQTEIVLAEAMHGAIVSDTLRIPWIPIATHPKILSFKWQDWCSSMNLEYNPHKTKCLSYADRDSGLKLSFQNIRDGLKNWHRKNSIANQLKEISISANPILSNEAKLKEMIERLEEKVEILKSDINSDIFSIKY